MKMNVDTMRRIDRFDRFHDAGPCRGDVLTRRVAFNRRIHIAKNFIIAKNSIALVNALRLPEPSTPCSNTTAGIDR
jgi:hypothetical protein